MSAPSKILAAAFVPRELGRAWVEGRLTDVELFKHQDTGTGQCLFVAHLESPDAWRALAALCEQIRPAQLCLRTIVPSIARRCQQYGEACFYDDGDGISGPRGMRYWGEGEGLQNFLESLGVKPGKFQNTLHPEPA